MGEKTSDTECGLAFTSDSRFLIADPEGKAVLAGAGCQVCAGYEQNGAVAMPCLFFLHVVVTLIKNKSRKWARRKHEKAIKVLVRLEEEEAVFTAGESTHIPFRNHVREVPDHVLRRAWP